jgi:hypothetical protein
LSTTLGDFATDVLGAGPVDVGDDHRRPERGQALGDDSAGACPAPVTIATRFSISTRATS